MDPGEGVSSNTTNTARGAQQVVQARNITGDIHFHGSGHGLSTAGVVLGSIGAVVIPVVGVFSNPNPVMGLIGISLGILALVFSAVGWIRARGRAVSSRGAVIAGYVLGIATLVAGVIGMIWFGQAADKQLGSVDTTTPSQESQPPASPTGPTRDVNQPDSTDDKVTAKVTCDRFVENRLKAPATAKFADYADAEVTYGSADKTYTVSTYVDSQNGFGAMLRTHYICTVTMTNPGETWKVIKLDVK